MSGDTHLTHIDEKGDVRMVDVSQKPDTERVAIAELDNYFADKFTF